MPLSFPPLRVLAAQKVTELVVCQYGLPTQTVTSVQAVFEGEKATSFAPGTENNSSELPWILREDDK